jgi:hypothetical protein
MLSKRLVSHHERLSTDKLPASCSAGRAAAGPMEPSAGCTTTTVMEPLPPSSLSGRTTPAVRRRAVAALSATSTRHNARGRHR